MVVHNCVLTGYITFDMSNKGVEVDKDPYGKYTWIAAKTYESNGNLSLVDTSR